jgi:RNA polymerase primary sigma factor
MIETINKLIRTSRALVQELGSRTDLRGNRQADGHPGEQGSQGPENRRRSQSRWRRRLAKRKIRILATSSRIARSSRRPEAVINLNLKEQTESVLKTLTPREEKGHQDAVWRRRRQRAHARRRWSELAVTREAHRAVEAKALRKLRPPPRAQPEAARRFLEGRTT